MAKSFGAICPQNVAWVRSSCDDGDGGKHSKPKEWQMP